MQVLVPCLIFLAVENVQLVRNEHLDAEEVLDSTQFKNAVAKELLKKKLSNLESSRQQNSLTSFLKKGGRNTGLRTAPKSSFHKDDDPSRKQSQMANTFIASSNLLFGTKSQPRKSCNTAGKQANKEGLDMGSLRELSGYNEEGGDFTALKESSKRTALNDSLSAVIKKRLFARKAIQDPISCYLSEPKKVTCMHKDIVYKIALPSSEVADDEIGRIVESIYRAVEGKNSGRSSLGESVEDAVSQKASLKASPEAAGSSKTTSEDSLKKKRASDDYLKSVFLNNLQMANQKESIPNYNANNPVFIPLLIPMAQPKLPVGYYSGLAIDPRLQIPVNLSAGVDTLNSHQTGRNVMFENGYGQFLVPDGLALPELNLKQRSYLNLTEEEEKRRNWLALMATNGLVPIDHKLMTQSLTQNSPRIIEEKDYLSNGNKLTVAETGEVLDKLLNKRQGRDTYFVRHQLRRNPSVAGNPIFSTFHKDGKKQVLTKVVQKLSDPGDFIIEEKKGCPCPCSTDLCATASRCTRRFTKSSSKCPMKLIFQLTSSSPVATKCSSTIPCSTTPKCSTCPDGCQPIPSCPYETTTSKPCFTKSNSCSDSDILSRVVSGETKGNEEPVESRQHLPLLPIHTSHLNWLPYSPQLFQPNKPSSQSDQPMSLINGGNPQPSANGKLLMERTQESVVLDNRKQLQYVDQLKNRDVPQQLENPDGQPEYPRPLRPEDQNGFSPQNSLPPNQMCFNSIQQPLSIQTNIDGSTHDPMYEPEAPDTPKHIELQSKPVPQSDHSNVTSRQNDIKTKKHRDSFFARLRSKFYKGLLQNGTDLKKEATDPFHGNQINNKIPLVQNKVMLGSSLFKFSPRNQTFGVERNNSSEHQLNHTTHTIDKQQQCLLDQTNQANDQTQTLINQTQPSTVNNINITITSMQPQPGQQGRLPTGNQTNQPQPSNNIYVQCPSSSTTQPLTSGQNGRTCNVTKIWLCNQQPATNITVAPNSACGNTTQPPNCQARETTTQPVTCQNPSNTNDSGNLCPIQNCQRSPNAIMPHVNPTLTEGTGVSRSRVAEVTSQYLQTQPSNLWPAPASHQMQGTALQDISQESPGSQFKTLDNYSPPPGWDKWLFPADRMNNAHQPHPPQMPLPTQIFPQAQPQKQSEQQSPQILRQPPNPAWRQNYMQAQNRLTWQQPPNRQLDPMWQARVPVEVPNEYRPNFRPRFSDQGDTRNAYGQPTKNDMHYSQRMEMKPYDERKWMRSNKTMGSGRIMGIGKPYLRNIIEQHIARVRRYLWKKRSKTSNHHSSRKPRDVKI